jgi:hypothetical protein
MLTENRLGDKIRKDLIFHIFFTGNNFIHETLYIHLLTYIVAYFLKTEIVKKTERVVTR